MPRVTLAEMQERVYHRLEENQLLYTSQEVTNAINENLMVLNCHAGWYQQTAILPTLSIPGRVIYDVPAPIVVPLNVKFDNRGIEKSSLDSASYSSANVLTKTGGPPRYWIPLGLRKFILTPIDKIGGRQIECTGIADVPPLVNPTDFFVLSDEFTNAVEDGSFITLILKEGGKILSDALRTIYPAWKAKMQELRRWESMKAPHVSEDTVSTR